MSVLFKTPKVKIPKAEAAAPVATIDDTQRERNESERLRKRRGSKSNQFTGPLGAPLSPVQTAPKQLTGQ